MGTFYDCQVSEIPGFCCLSDLSEQLLILRSTVFICYLGRGENPVIWVNIFGLEGTDIAHHTPFCSVLLLPENLNVDQKN